jgi:hypothetical protein
MASFPRRLRSAAQAIALAVGCAACSSPDISVAPGDDDAATDTTLATDAAEAGADSTGDSARDTAAGDTSTTVEGGADASDAAIDAAPAPTCTDPTTFPTFGKGCTLDLHCSFGLHQLDCCGSLGAIGFNHAFADDFAATEDAYRKTCAVCDCLPKETRTESGITTADNSRIAVRCDVGLCKTYVK